MADRAFTPVMFGLEKNLVHLACDVTFGSNGAATLNSANSLGFVAMNQYSVSFTATGTSTTSITAVSNFTGLYNGMILSGTNVAAGSVISAINAGAGTFTLSNATTGAISSVTATGGYQLQLGKTQLNGVSLDTYNKLLGISIMSSVSGLQGGVSTQASSPAGPAWFEIGNTVASATAGTGASIYLMCGTYNGAAATFKNVQPASGERLHIQVLLGNSTAK